MKVASLCNGIFLFSLLRRLVLLFLVIISAIYLINFFQSMDIIHNQVFLFSNRFNHCLILFDELKCRVPHVNLN